MGSFSILDGILHASIFVKIVLLILIFLSIGTWSVFLQKKSSFKILDLKNKQFEKKFWSGIMLEEYYNDVKKQKRHYMFAEIFIATMEEWALSEVTKSVMAIEFTKVGIRERIVFAAKNGLLNYQKKMSQGMTLLSVTASLAPFIGLFGTVIGIMNSFASISGSSSVTLSVIAPGIAEALFSTALALFVSIPAFIFYSLLSNQIDLINENSEKFSTDLTNILSRELDNFSVNNYKKANNM